MYEPAATDSGADGSPTTFAVAAAPGVGTDPDESVSHTAWQWNST